jgi:putative phosphoesterase
MKLGILGDIHGNSVALAAVLKEARKASVEKLLILGDLIGYYYDAVGVLDLLEPWSKTVVRGNHEDMFRDMGSGSRTTESVRLKYGSGALLAHQYLSAEQKNCLINLPETEIESVDNIRFQLCHGSPWSTNQYIYPDSETSLLKRCVDKRFDFVLLGHTHYPMVHLDSDTAVINPGSVGQSRVKGGIAQWGLLNTGNKVYVQQSTPYDVAPVLAAVRKHDPDVSYLQNVLLR